MAIKSSLAREREQKKRKAILIAVPILLVLLYFGLVGLSRVSSFDLYDVVVKGNETIETDYLIKKVTDFCSGTSFLFSKKSILVCSLSTLRENIQNEWPRIETLRIRRTGFHEVTLAMTERTPVGQTCVDSCLVFDADGFAFRPPLGDEGKSLPVWNGVAFKPGDFIIPTERFHTITAFLETLVPHIGNIQKITLIPPDMEIIAQSGVKYLFEEKGDLVKAIRNIDEFTTSFTKTDKNFLKTVETIDARFGNKFFYTLKATSTGKALEKTLSTASSTKR